MSNDENREKNEEKAAVPVQPIIDMGSTVVKNSRGTVHCLTIVGQVEGHTLLPDNLKSTKYEHVLPLLAALEQKLQSRGLRPLFLTGHTGWTDNFEFAFAHKDKLCSPFQKRVPDPTAPYDAYDESDDTEEAARAGYLQAVGR